MVGPLGCPRPAHLRDRDQTGGKSVHLSGRSTMILAAMMVEAGSGLGKVVGEKGEDGWIGHFVGVGELEAVFRIKPSDDFVTLEERLLERQ